MTGPGRGAGARPTPGAGLGRTAGRGASATMVGQLIRIVVQLTGIVILGRLLGPSDYGLVASVTAIIGVGEVFRDFGLASAAVQVTELSRNQKDNLFWANTLIGAALTGIAFACAPLIAGLYGDDRLVQLTQVLSFTFLLNGLATQFRAHLTRNLRLFAFAASEISAQVGALAVGIGMALGGFGFWALAGQQLSQGVLMLVLLLVVCRWFPGFFHRRTEMSHFFTYGSGLAGSQLLGYASRNADSVVIGATLGAGPLGLYNRAFQLLMLPLNQINAPSTRVALPVLSRLQNDRKRYGEFIVLGQAIMLHIVTLVLAFSCAQATPVIAIALGDKWLAAAPIFQILSIAGFFQAAAYASFWVYLSKGITKQNFYLALVTRPVVIGCILLGSLWGVYGVAAGYALGVGLIWPISLIQISRVTDAPALRMFLTGVRALGGYSFATAVSYLSTLWLPGGMPLVNILVGGVAMAAALAVVALVWPAFRRDLASIARSRKFLRDTKASAPGKIPDAAPSEGPLTTTRGEQ
jgi:O-antigen/teichoic acid export membrane protein